MNENPKKYNYIVDHCGRELNKRKDQNFVALPGQFDGTPIQSPDDYDPIDDFEYRMKPKQLVWEKYPKFDMSPYKMVSQMEFPLSDEIVRQSIYRQKCQWTSVKKAADLVDDEFDLVIRMRTDLEFHDRVPLEAPSIIFFN